MKRLLLVLTLLFTTLIVTAQGVEDTNAAKEVFVVVEQMPVFPGGDVELFGFIYENLKYPASAREKGIEGKVILRFCVTYEGAVDQVSVVRGVDPDLDAEATRVIKTLPKWHPGMQGGVPVNVWYSVPITFDLENDEILNREIQENPESKKILDPIPSDIQSTAYNYGKSVLTEFERFRNHVLSSAPTQLADRKLKRIKGEFVFTDNSIYDGERKQGLADGQGRRTFSDGSVYQGQFVQGFFNGYGVLVDNQGGKYEGNFLNDQINGIGRLTFKNGDTYIGNWLNNYASGDGKFYYQEGGVYEGKWANGRKEGKGKLFVSNSITYEGGWLSDYPNGNGICLSFDGSIYEGNWVNGIREGKGKLTVPDTYTYEGNWANDSFNGEGKYQSSNGNLYVGNWKNGNRDGFGKFTKTDGEVYEGNWANGLKEGKGKLTYKEGVVYEGDFVEGNRTGKGRITFLDDTYYDGNWINDVATGKGKMTMQNGAIYEGDFVGGDKDGFGKIVFKDSSYYEGEWIKNFPSGKGEMYFNGGEVEGFTYEGDWHDGVKQGTGIAVYFNGEIYEGDWLDGLRHGNGTLTLNNGDVYIGQFTNGAATGQGRFTKTNGDVFEGTWENGQSVEVFQVYDNTSNNQGIKIAQTDKGGLEDIEISEEESAAIGRLFKLFQALDDIPYYNRNEEDSNIEYDYNDNYREKHSNDIQKGSTKNGTQSQQRRSGDSSSAASKQVRHTIIGRCEFSYSGSAPRYTTHFGSMTVHHNGDFKKTSVQGKYDCYSGSGTIWVIFNSVQSSSTFKFEGNGSVQTCNNF